MLALEAFPYYPPTFIAEDSCLFAKLRRFVAAGRETLDVPQMHQSAIATPHEHVLISV
jgi:hypothetical protein